MLRVDYHFIKDFDGEISEEEILCNLYLNDEVIGFSEVYLIKGGPALADYLDQVDEYCNWAPQDAMYSIEFDGETGIHKNIGYLHNIVIYEDYRGKGYAGFFLDNIEKIAKDKGMETMILQPCPLERDNPDVYFYYIENLIAFYEKKGYNVYETNNIMRTPYYTKALSVVSEHIKN